MIPEIVDPRDGEALLASLAAEDVAVHRYIQTMGRMLDRVTRVVAKW